MVKPSLTAVGNFPTVGQLKSVIVDTILYVGLSRFAVDLRKYFKAVLISRPTLSFSEL